MTNSSGEGYRVLQGLLSSRQIDDLISMVDPIFDQWMNENREDYIKHGLINMHSLTHAKYFANSEDRIRFFEMITPPELTDEIQGPLWSEIYFHNSQLFFNPHDKSQRPYWHRDIQYTSANEVVQQRDFKDMTNLHIRIPLVPERGVELIPGTDRRWDHEHERNVRLELDGHKNHEDLVGAVLIELIPGDVLIFSANMIHRGHYAANESRKALDICVGKSHWLTAKFLDPCNLPTDTELTRIKNNTWYKNALKLADTLSMLDE